MLKLKLASLFLLLGLGLTAIAADSGFGFDDDEEEAEQSVERYQPRPMEDWLEDLKQEVNPEEIVELPLANEETLVALHLRAFTHQPKGQIILLPGANEHPNWPRGIATLRQGLATQGWHSLALSLPFYEGWQNPERQLVSGPLLSPTHLKRSAKKAPQENTTDEDLSTGLGFTDADDEEDTALTDSNSTEDANLDLFNQLSQTSAARLTAALNYLPKAKKQVLVLQGESLFWLTEWLSKNKLTPNQSLVLLFTRQPVGSEAKQLEKLLEEFTHQPILDIYLPTSRHQQALAQQRKIAYLRAGNKHAVQLEAKSNFSPTNQADQDWLVKRVEGWLRRLEKK